MPLVPPVTSAVFPAKENKFGDATEGVSMQAGSDMTMAGYGWQIFRMVKSVFVDGDGGPVGGPSLTHLVADFVLNFFYDHSPRLPTCPAASSDDLSVHDRHVFGLMHRKCLGIRHLTLPTGWKVESILDPSPLSVIHPTFTIGIGRI